MEMNGNPSPAMVEFVDCETKSGQAHLLIRSYMAAAQACSGMDPPSSAKTL
jgi:hypothetical protein